MDEAGPDYIGYYKHRIEELFAQDEPSLLPSEKLEPHGEFLSGEAKCKDIECHVDQSTETDDDCESGLLFSSEIGDRLSYFDKDMLRTILQECVFVLNEEVEEVLENFIELNLTRSDLDNKIVASPLILVKEDDKPAYKKPRATPLSVNISTNSSDCGHSAGQDEHHSLSLTQNGYLQSEAIKSQSLKFSMKLKYMEQQLDAFLDVLVSKCRSMAHLEKVQLRWLIQELPAEALDRVVDILGRRNPSVSKCSEQIHVELENEDHVTLWRLYYYARAVSNASQS